MTWKCNCMECRVRIALSDQKQAPDGGVYVDFDEAIPVLLTVLTDALSHYPNDATEHVAEHLLEAVTAFRERGGRWSGEKAAGHA